MISIYIILEILAAYLIGSVSSAVWFGKLLYGVDVREHGSGNAGATNVIRVLGYKAGLPVMLFDIFKGWIAVQLVSWVTISGLTPEALIYLKIGAGVAVVMGHVFPVFASFRGGKGVGTIAGVGFALFPLAVLIVLGVFIIVLIFTHFVSLSSVTAAFLFPFVVYFVCGIRHPGLIGLAILTAIFIPITHRKNIRRLLKGEERKFEFKKKSTP
ncbi:MAG: glycerol-3-phosphate 1-O-acyltransferase PlsY [Bacteroidales bacterium]|nr:glycerol-3-phosphate 1-O-acyltransferase PlsY [Bacteroidales bacterium]MDD4603021.1 glycerol-3-phosphate 1-O-acyltransferase PlsY [Bacteroidales bacterium]